MDYEYEHDDYAPRVLWGRVAFFLIALLLVFFLGRCTAGGADEAEVGELRNQVMALSSENQQLENELQAVQATQQGEGGEEEEPADDEPEDEGEETEDGQDAVDARGETYTVQQGDTLVSIARQFYGEAEKYTLIAEANNLEGSTLTVGQELVIPPEE